MGDLVAYRDHLPSSHRLSTQYSTQYQDDLLQDIKESKDLDSVFVKVSGLSAKATEESWNAINLFMLVCDGPYPNP